MSKNYPNQRFFISILSLILSLSMSSCTSGLEKKLVGTWKGSDFLFVKTGGIDLVATINGGLDQHLKSKLILNEDGTYKKLVGEYDNGSGTWELEDDKLITTGEDGNELIYTLLKVTDNELVTIHDVTIATPNGEQAGKITLSYSQ